MGQSNSTRASAASTTIDTSSTKSRSDDDEVETLCGFPATGCLRIPPPLPAVDFFFFKGRDGKNRSAFEDAVDDDVVVLEEQSDGDGGDNEINHNEDENAVVAGRCDAESEDVPFERDDAAQVAAARVAGNGSFSFLDGTPVLEAPCTPTTTTTTTTLTDYSTLGSPWGEDEQMPVGGENFEPYCFLGAPTASTSWSNDDERAPADGEALLSSPADARPRLPPPDSLLANLVAIDCGMVNASAPNRKKKKDKTRNVQKPVLRRVCILDGWGDPLLNVTVRVPAPSYLGTTTAAVTAASTAPAGRRSKAPRRNGNARRHAHPQQRLQHHPQGYRTQFAQYVSDNMLPRITGCGDDLNEGIDPKDAKKRAASLLKGKIVVGHSLGCDFGALGLCHPRSMIRDTASYRPFLREDGQKQKLSDLIERKLGRTIQKSDQFHCSEEDALAALDLYKSVWREWEDSLLPVTDVRPNKSKRPKRKKRRKQRSNARVMQQEQVAVELHELSKLRNLFSLVTFPVRVLRDAAGLANDAAVLGWRATKLQLGVRPAPIHLQTLQKMQVFLRVDAAMLMCHSVVEFTRIMSVVVFHLVATTKESTNRFVALFDAGVDGMDSMYLSIHWSAASLLVGASLLVATVTGPSRKATARRTTLQSRICSFVLADYHFANLFMPLLQQPSCDSLSNWRCILSPSTWRLSPHHSVSALYHAVQGSWFLSDATVVRRHGGRRRKMFSVSSLPSVCGLVLLVCWAATLFDTVGNYVQRAVVPPSRVIDRPIKRWFLDDRFLTVLLGGAPTDSLAAPRSVTTNHPQKRWSLDEHFLLL